MILWLQVLAGIAWLAVFIQRLPGVVRLVRGVPRMPDLFAFPLPLVAIVQVGFSVRWWVWHQAVNGMGSDELLFWAGLYVASALSAAMFFVLFFKRPVQ